MLDTIWHVSGTELDIDKFVSQFKIDADSIYRKGDKARKGKIHDQSGLSVLVSENLNVSEHLKEIEEFIHSYKSAFILLKERGYDSCFSMGCTVGTKDQFTKSVGLTASQLGLLNECGVSFEFSAYPASDDE